MPKSGTLLNPQQKQLHLEPYKLREKAAQVAALGAPRALGHTADEEWRWGCGGKTEANLPVFEAILLQTPNSKPLFATGFALRLDRRLNPKPARLATSTAMHNPVRSSSHDLINTAPEGERRALSTKAYGTLVVGI